MSIPHKYSPYEPAFGQMSPSPLPYDLPWDVVMAITGRPKAPTLMQILLDLVPEQMLLGQKLFQVSGHRSPFRQRLIGRSWAQRSLAPPLEHTAGFLNPAQSPGPSTPLPLA